ncbi:MAG: ferritin-like domain-containing protein [Thermoleophilaceae bacterium]
MTGDPASRRGFLKAAGGVGAGGALGLFAVACGEDEEPKPETATTNDLDIVNYALGLEYVEHDFYRAVIGAKILSGRDLTIARRIESNEAEHVKALEAAARNLDGEPAPREETDFSSVLGVGRGKVLRTAATLEGVGAGAYLGQVRFVESKEILASLLSIHSVEGRHAAVLNRLVGRPFSPAGAFAEPLSKEQVTKAIEPYLA